MKKNKKYLIWTKKGGVGKTNISAELILQLNFPAITNETSSMLSRIIPNNRLKILKPDEEVPNYETSMIFDFGGYLDSRIIEVVRQSNYVIVPTIPEISDIQGCIETIQTLKQYTNNIVVIANKTEHKNDIDIVKEAIEVIGNYPIFEIKKSRALPNIYIEKKSIKDTVANKPLLKYAYKKVLDQFENLIYHISA